MYELLWDRAGWRDTQVQLEKDEGKEEENTL